MISALMMSFIRKNGGMVRDKKNFPKTKEKNNLVGKFIPN